jgi:PAS domain S-box-containing protein
MEDRARQWNLVLILARDLVSRLTTASFVVDADGTLIYFNEAAEPLLGRTYAEAGELRAGEWASEWNPTDEEGRPIPLADLPLGIAFGERREAHRSFRITRPDGATRWIAVTAIPLFARADELVGAVALFWEDRARADV